MPRNRPGRQRQRPGASEPEPPPQTDTGRLQRAHGYLIEEYLHSLGFLSLEMSTLYRTLRQLERDGLLYSSWEPGPAGPARRVYSLTDAGRGWLDSWAGVLDAYRGMIDRFFGLYGGGRPGAPDT
jgi:poly-beta-hydroxybutyrate-responsive repressor